eukprot:Lithocolla_globosa_v1_NODE_4284_length_1471_cov_40.466808.p1 type:complete len:122 gc:universal NODE_4284_length_1471_cov_40.466808:622-987(+)
MNPCVMYLKPLLRLQKKIARLITFAEFRAHAQPLFSHYFYHVSLLGFRQIHEENVHIPLKKFQQLKDTHTHATRSSTNNKLFVHYNKTKNFGQRTISHQTTLVWNKLSGEIRQIEKFQSLQ